MSREVSFDLGGRHIAAQEWGDASGKPVLALHGWLDNSASFNMLAPYLSDTHLVALDLTGHGQSSHKLDTGPYNIWEDVPDIFAVADHLGWDKFSLLGHSRGAIISMLAAGTVPDRIENVALIEGLFPFPVNAQEAPEQLARSIEQVRAKEKSTLPVYPTVELAAKARQRGRFTLTFEQAYLLAERGLKVVDGGYSWSSDPRLMAASAFKLGIEHISAFLSRTTAPVHLYLGNEGMPKFYPEFMEIVPEFPQVHIEMFEGDHYLHMGDKSGEIAKLINTFFKADV